MYFVDPHRAHCPDNHRLHDVELTLEDSILRCKYKFPAPGGRGFHGECGRLMLAIAGFHFRDGRKRVLLAPITIQDFRHMEERHMTVEEMLEYLGLGPQPPPRRP